MPTLHWIGKEAVVKHHKDVPYRLLEPVAALSCTPSPFKGEPVFGFPASVGAKAPNAGVKGGGEGKSSPSVDANTSTNQSQNTENLIVQGDNLHALKALLPRYAGQVKCIYIDPPYNTGNEGWVYNDNVNSAEIKRWLGEVVGKEGETLDRHDRWLCMMYPRLLLLKQFLREDGAIFVSIDDNEVASLRLLMDEIFGAGNFVANVVWRSSDNSNNDAKQLSTDHNHLVIYSKISNWQPKKAGDYSSKRSHFKNPDNDPRGAWFDGNPLNSPKPRPNLTFDLIAPNGNIIKPPKNGWRWSITTINEKISSGEIKFTENNLSIRRRTYLADMEALPPSSLWVDIDETGHNRQAKSELKSLFFDKKVDELFSTPKPTRFLQRVLELATDKDSLILDSFAGSGTTAHAVLKQNAEDGGNRRFILVEMDENIAQNVTAERVRRVAQGYRKGKAALTPALSQGERELNVGDLLDNPLPSGEGAQSAGEGKDWVAGLGGGFQFCKLSAEPLFTALGQIRSDVTFAQLAEFVWFVETGTGFTGKANSPLIGVHQGRAIYLLYNGILKDKSVGGGNVLTQKVLDILPRHDGAKVIFAAANRLGAPKLAREQIVIKQTPYALDV
jgi:site-specific DNA-methyltransferase (adenine-specific)/adenine-specific DNA-methyltransferase